jgi:hypothetical protein
MKKINSQDKLTIEIDYTIKVAIAAKIEGYVQR